MEIQENQKQEPKKGFFQSTTAKMIMVGLLTLVLLIPLSFVQELITERSSRQKEVVQETTSKWGENTVINGPILKIAYHDNATNYIQFAYFFPKTLHNSIQTKMEKPLERSIYKSNVFSSQMTISGNYSLPNFASKNIPMENIYWNQSKIIIQTDNLKSLKDEVKMTIGNQKLPWM